MLDDTVDPADIDEGAHAWREQSQRDTDIITGLTHDLNGIVSAGWRGESADAAIRALGPVNDWAASVTEAAGQTAQLLDTSGYYAGQAKVAVPPPVHFDSLQSLTSTVFGGPIGFGVDAFAQDRAQQEAHAEAVRVMNNVYSAPINDNRAAVPVYPQLTDPTLQPPEPSPSAGAGLPGSGIPGGGGGGAPGGYTPYQPPAVAGLQGAATGAGMVEGGQLGPAQPTAPRQSGAGPGPGVGGQGPGTAAAALPFVPPMGGVGGDERTRRGFRAGSGAGRPGGVGGRPGGGSGGGASFGPRGSGAVGAGAGDGRWGAGPGSGGPGGAGLGGGAAGARGGGGPGGVPLAGAGRGQGGADSEHRRPSYLIEMDDVFNDGRKVAPPVIGEDPPEYYR